METCPARLSREETEKIQRLAELAYEALRMKSYARMDFMKNDQGEFFCLEANTLPGMTPPPCCPRRLRLWE